MRMVLVLVAAWAGLAVVAAGLFVAVIRGGGGTALAPLPASGLADRDGVIPAQRAPGEAAVPVLEAAMPTQRTPGEHDERTVPVPESAGKPV